MNQTTKLIVAFVGAAAAGNLLSRAIIASAPTPPTSAPLGLQALTAIGLAGGGYVAWTMRNDSGQQDKDVAFAAALIAGVSGGALAATTGVASPAPQLGTGQ